MAIDNSKIEFDLDVLLNNPNTKTTIEIGGGSLTQLQGGVLLHGFLVSTPSFGGSNTYSNPLDNDILGKLNDYASIFQGVSGSANLGSISNATRQNFIIKSQIQTANIWTGSERFSFDLQMAFISYKTQDNSILQAIRTLMSCVNPESTGNASIGALASAVLAQDISNFSIRTIAPRGYFTYTEPKFGTILAFGTHTVRIGKWFLAKDLNIKSVRLDVSPEPRTDGKPLYCVVTVSFESFKMLSAGDVAGFFTDPK